MTDLIQDDDSYCQYCGKEEIFCQCPNECPICGTTNDNKHHLKCQNNKNPFDELINFGFD